MAFTTTHTMLVLRKYRLRFLISTFIGVIYFFYLLYSEIGAIIWKPDYWIYVLATVAMANTIGFLIGLSDRRLNKWIPWKDNLSIRLLTGFLANLCLALAIMTLGSYLFFGLYEGSFDAQMLINQHHQPMVKLAIITVVAALIYTIIYFALFSYNQYAVTHIDAAKHQRKQLKLQFEALKSQLSPHYLFNCLNTISSLIFKDPHLAEDFIRRLAQTYQYILTNNDRRFVLLKEEIEFVKSYNYLLQVRFENNLHLEINLPKNVLDSKIPPLTLQMLVENAVKHNIITRHKPLNIYISAIDNTDIKVTNTKTETPANVSSFHVGLDNIKKRYGYFTDKKIKIDNAKKFTVKLPVIKNELARSA